jgi:hypothetical protein
MQSYEVQSGPLKIFILAETAYDAALEAVRWWDDSASQERSGAEHRASLDPAVEVRMADGPARRSSRIPRTFPTVNLLARAAGHSRSEVWSRLLREKVGSLN